MPDETLLPSPRESAKLLWVLWLLLLAYGIFIARNFAPVAAGADSGGYFNSGRLLSEGKLTTPMRTVPEFQPKDAAPWVPLGYTDDLSRKILKPTYPVGLPMHYALGMKLAGLYWGPLIISVLGTLGAVLFCYLCLAELGVSIPWRIAGAAAMAISPMVVFASLTPMSDIYATMWDTVAVYAALRSRRARIWGVWCGVAFALAVLVRPSNTILLPMLVLLLWDWRSLIGAFFGGLPGAVWMAYYNKAMYGSPFVSGYGPIFNAFGWEHFRPSVQNYVETFPWVLPLVVPALIGVLWLPWKQHARVLIAFLLWFWTFVLFYAFYDITQQAWWYLRFVLPGFPPIIFLGVLALEGRFKRAKTDVLSEKASWPSYAAAVLVVTISLWTSVKYSKMRHVLLMGPYQKPYVVATDWAKQNMPADALIACMQTSSAFYFYTDFPILRWDQITEPDHVALGELFRKAHRPVYAVLFPFEYEDALKKQLPWDWEKVADFKDVAIWKLKE